MNECLIVWEIGLNQSLELLFKIKISLFILGVRERRSFVVTFIRQHFEQALNNSNINEKFSLNMPQINDRILFSSSAVKLFPYSRAEPSFVFNYEEEIPTTKRGPNDQG